MAERKSKKRDIELRESRSNPRSKAGSASTGEGSAGGGGTGDKSSQQSEEMRVAKMELEQARERSEAFQDRVIASRPDFRTDYGNFPGVENASPKTATEKQKEIASKLKVAGSEYTSSMNEYRKWQKDYEKETKLFKKSRGKYLKQNPDYFRRGQIGKDLFAIYESKKIKAAKLQDQLFSTMSSADRPGILKTLFR
jgi:hypothetical protein